MIALLMGLNSGWAHATDFYVTWTIQIQSLMNFELTDEKDVDEFLKNKTFIATIENKGSDELRAGQLKLDLEDPFCLYKGISAIAKSNSVVKVRSAVTIDIYPAQKIGTLAKPEVDILVLAKTNTISDSSPAQSEKHLFSCKIAGLASKANEL